MVKLTGEFGWEAQEALKDLHIGIDVGKNIITQTHNFEIKLLAIDNIIAHIEFNYSHYNNLYDFFSELSNVIIELRDKLEKLRKGEIHFVVEEEAVRKKDKLWLLKHRREIEEELKEEKLVDEKIIITIHEAFTELRTLFVEAEHLFSLYIREAKIKKFKIKLEKDEAKVKHILEKLMRFIFAYEKIFQQARRKLSIK